MPILLNDRQKFNLQVQSVGCPYCHVPSGRPCRNYRGQNVLTAHRKRVEAYEAEEGAVGYLKKIRSYTPEDADIIDFCAQAKMFFYDGPGVIMPSGRRLNGRQMRLLVSAAGYNPLRAPRSFHDIGGGLNKE